MRIEFYTQYGGAYASASFVGQTQITLADSGATNDTWLKRQLTGIVPAGATEASLVLQFLQPNGQAGAVHIDDVSFGIADKVALAGDYNHDGIVDQRDYDTWKSSFGSTSDLNADGNDNGIIDAADYMMWRSNLGAMLANGAAASVPEPDGLAIAVGAALSAIGFHLFRTGNGAG